MEEIDYLVKKLKLKKLWSNDYLAEFYWSPYKTAPPHIPEKFETEHRLSDWAYYLIPEGSLCPFHMLYSDESWQFCAGGPLELIIIDGKDKIKTVTIGDNFYEDQEFIYVVPGNTWFAARCKPGSKYTLITHNVCPGFQKRDEFEGYYEEMIKLIPSHPKLAQELSWPKDLDRKPNY